MYLSIDIGGTKTLIALFSKHGRIVRKFKFKTDATLDGFMNDLMAALDAFTLDNRKLRAVTVAIPGIVQKNCSVLLGNRDWGSVDLYTPIKMRLDCPVYLENDANLATVYESYRLPGRIVFLTFSTGIGGGIATNGRLLPESSNFEPGHKIYSIGSLEAEWEDIAAASALEKYFGVHPATDLRGKLAMKEVAKRIALGLPDIIKEYRPDTIVLGGPLGKIFKLYVKYLPNLNVRYRRPRRPLESVVYGGYLYAKGRLR